MVTQDLTPEALRVMADDMESLAVGHRESAVRSSLDFDRALLRAQASDFERMARLLRAAAAEPARRARLLVAIDEMQERVEARARQLVTIAEVQRTLGGV